MKRHPEFIGDDDIEIGMTWMIPPMSVVQNKLTILFTNSGNTIQLTQKKIDH